MGVYLYVLLRVICSILTLIFEPLVRGEGNGRLQLQASRHPCSVPPLPCPSSQGLYHHGSFLPQYFYLYNSIIINAAQIWALYILALFCASAAACLTSHARLCR